MRFSSPASCLALAVSLAGTSLLDAQVTPPQRPRREPPRDTAARPAPANAPIDTVAAKRLSWRSIGPANQAGRVSVIVGVPGDRDTWYVAGANGGIFKTINNGTTFKPIFDTYGSPSIGAIAIAPSDPNVIYVGTGEGNPRNNASIGDGMYKSIDAGDTFTYIGLPASDKIARIVIDARDPNIVYSCVLGREWGPSEERGLYKTIDGGKSWKRVLYINPQTSCSDVDTDPTNSNIVYAGMYTYLRKAWHLESGGGQTALYKSVDGGATWKKMTNGMPKGPMDRIGISVARSDPNVVYAVSETKSEGELWRTDNAGESWRTVNRDPNINFRPFYYSDIRVDPQDPNRIYSLSGSLYLSEDGGANFRRIANDVHGDHQAMWIDPLDPSRILSGSDGGFQVSYDRSRTWEVINNIAFTQFYHIALDMQQPYMVCGGLQDNGNWCGPSQTLSGQGIRKNDWFTVSGGDGFFTVPDVSQPNLIYSVSQGGNIILTDTKSGSQRSIHPDPNRIGSAGDAMAGHKYRFNWNPPIVLSPQDPKTVYFGGNVVFKTTNYGQSWENISPDLTTNDKSKQQSSGGPIVVDNTAAEFHSSILTIAPSPLDANVIWVGTDDGNVQVTRDGGKTWTNVIKNITGLAPNAWIPTIDASPSDVATAYVAADHHQDNDYAPYAFKTTDYGKTWKRITGNLPANAGWMHVVREDPKNKNLLYAGTELGLWASWDGGTRWESIRYGLPAVPIRDIKVHPRDNDIVIGTHGRGAYILDDATPLQRRGDAMAADAYLFDIRPATRWIMANTDGNLGQKTYVAKNPPSGALITYQLKNAPAGEVTLTVTDKAGKVVRHIRRAPKDAGVNRTAWDLRYDGPRQPGGGNQPATGPGAPGGQPGLAGRGAQPAPAPPGAEAGEAGPEGRFAAAGPYVVPGEYTVTLRVGSSEMSKPVHVDMDPRVRMTQADLVAQLDAGMKMMDLSNRSAVMLERTDDLIRQLGMLSDQLSRTGAAGAARAGAEGDTPPANSAASGAPAGGGQDSRGANPALDKVKATLETLRDFRDDSLTRPIPGLGYRQYPRLREEIASLMRAITSAANVPTDPQKARTLELTDETDKLSAMLEGIIAKDVTQVNQLLSGTPHVITGTARAPAQRVIP